MLTQTYLQAEAIIDGTERAFNDLFGGHFDRGSPNEVELWPLVASNSKETEAMVKGLERAHSMQPYHR